MLAVEYVRLSRSMKSFFAKICQTFRKNLSLPMLFAVTVFGFVYMIIFFNTFSVIYKYDVKIIFTILFAAPVSIGLFMVSKIRNSFLVKLYINAIVLLSALIILAFLYIFFLQFNNPLLEIVVSGGILFIVYFLAPFLLTLTATFPLRKYIAKKYSKR